MLSAYSLFSVYLLAPPPALPSSAPTRLRLAGVGVLKAVLSFRSNDESAYCLRPVDKAESQAVAPVQRKVLAAVRRPAVPGIAAPAAAT